MRHKFTSQNDLFSPIMRSLIVKELKGTSNALDATPSVMDRVFRDLSSTHRIDNRQGGDDGRASPPMCHP